MEKPAEDKTFETTRYGYLPTYLKVVFVTFTTISAGLAFFYIFGFTVGGKVFSSTAYYYLLVAILFPCTFLILPARKRDKHLKWYDLIAAFLAFGISIYFFVHAWEISEIGWIPASPFNFTLGLVFILLSLEGGRRIGGNIYLAICIIAGLYPIFADYMPWVFWGQSFSVYRTISYLSFSTMSFLGIPARVMGEILIGFLVFAGVLIASGAGKFFLNLALSLFGTHRGGPAKVAVVSSGFFGSLSGSALSNIVSTGSITIPTMIRTGYPPHYAAAIEACASTGGILMPPVMGAIAFIMCAFLEIEYSDVMIASAIPAVLYYWGLLMQVDAYAAKVGLKGLPKEKIPSFRDTLKKGWPFIVAMIFLVWGLVYMRWSTKAPFYASGLMFLLSFINKETRMTPNKILETLILIGSMITQAMTIFLPIGILVCGLSITGSTSAITAELISYGGGNVFMLLIIGAIICYLLGMIGMISAAYIFLAVTMAPAAVKAGGLNELAVHLFIIYYAMLAGITPPVALGSFLAAGMAGAQPIKTSFTSMRLGVVVYIVPIFFVFNPSLIFEGPILETLYLFSLCILGIVFIAGGMEGYLLMIGKIGFITRPLIIIAGVLIAFPSWNTTYIGAALATLVILIRRIIRQSSGWVAASSDTK